MLVALGMLCLSFTQFKIDRTVIDDKNKTNAEVVKCEEIYDRGVMYDVYWKIQDGDNEGKIVSERSKKPVEIDTSEEVYFNANYPMYIYTNNTINVHNELYIMTFVVLGLSIYLITKR